MRFFRKENTPAAYEEEKQEEEKQEGWTAEQLALREQSQEKDFYKTMHRVFTDAVPGGVVLVDEKRAKRLYVTGRSKLIKTSKSSWVVVNRGVVPGWGNEYQFNIPMHDVYKWLTTHGQDLPPEVEEWAKSVTE